MWGLLCINMAEHMFGVYLVKKSNTKRKVWKNFGIMATEDRRIIDREKYKPICRTCESGFQEKGATPQTYFSTCASTTLSYIILNWHLQANPRVSKQSHVAATNLLKQEQLQGQ